MANRPSETVRLSLIDRVAESRVRRFWARAGGAAAAMDLGALRALRGRARRLRGELDRLIAVAEGRLALPAVGSSAMNRPPGADWIWRPGPWRFPVEPRGHASAARRTPLAEGVVLFHDCPLGEIALRQDRNARAGDLAAFGVTLEVYGFAGSFVSLAVDLPPEATSGLGRRHVVRLEIDAEAERPTGFHCRLNLRQGPNVVQIHAGVPAATHDAWSEFDLAYAPLRDLPVDGLWLDLIPTHPAMNAIRLRDLRFSRRLRAEL
jgi:hypothetical protein